MGLTAYVLADSIPRENISDSPIQSEAWETQYPDVLYWNPEIEGPDSKAELV